MPQSLPASQNHRSAPAPVCASTIARASIPAARQAAAPLVLAIAVLLACAAVALRPGSACAASYTIPAVDIAAQAETDGSLHVVEQRTFDFEGEHTVVAWTFDDLPEGSEIVVNSVRMVSMGADGAASGYPQVLGSVPFVLSWRDGGGPGGDAYSFDRARNTVYVFFDATDERRLIELDYTLIDGVTAYSDIGEVDWKFIDGEWAADSENVTLTVSLPVPSGATVEPGANVRAWGHGPGDGTVEVGDDGGVVYRIPRVEDGSFAEAHVIFPADWLTNLPSGTAQPHRADRGLSAALSEEEAWVDRDSRAFSIELVHIIACALVCAAAVLVGLVAYLRFGREHVPAFKGRYWRAVPAEDVHPALIGRLWRWGRASSDDFIATAMRLADRGAIRIVEAAPAGDGAQEGGFRLERLTDAGKAAEGDPLDAKALEILFDEIAEGGDSVGFDQIAAFRERLPQRFEETMRAWQKLLSDEVDACSFFDLKSRAWQKRTFALAAVAAFAALVSWSASGNAFPLVFGVLATGALILLGNYMPRRSVEGNELCARSKALRNWLRDLSTLDEQPPSNAAAQGGLMIYAYLFGVSDEALRGILGDQPLPQQPSWLPWYAGVPVSGAEAFQAAVSRSTAKRDGV